MAFSQYTPSLYNIMGRGASSLGMNSVVNSSYNPVQTGSASASVCPQGGIQSGLCQANDIPRETYVSGEIPLTNVHEIGNKTNAPYQNLSTVVKDAYKDTMAQSRVSGFDLQCCPNNPSNCQEQVYWRASFKGCPTTYADDPSMRCEINPVGDRISVADLDPLKFERSIAQEAQWNPYRFMNGRQLWMQFLMHDMTNTSDPYTRPIPNLDQSYCMQQNLKGPPAFTVF
jgi:hypothetical protein